jgi:hypothetical protein
MAGVSRLPAEEIERRRAGVRRLWDAGLPTRAMAKELNMPHGSVISTVRLLQLPPRPHAIRDRQPPKPKPKRAPKQAKRVDPGRQPPTPPTLPEPPPDAPVRGMFDEPCRCCCQFPVREGSTPRDTLFCARPAAPGSPYCAEHRHVACRGKPARRTLEAVE